jgi:hypothetical protein
MFARAALIIGSPQGLALLETLTRKRRHEIAGWLARLECIARKLLFADAANLTLEPRTARAVARATKTRTRARNPLDLAQPSIWPARFRLAPPHDPRAVSESHAPRIRALWGPPSAAPTPAERTPAQTTPAPLHFAMRAEALRRVLENPHPHVLRLARLFRRLNRRFPEAAARYAIATARPHATDPGDPRLVIEVLAIAMIAAELFANTS